MSIFGVACDVTIFGMWHVANLFLASRRRDYFWQVTRGNAIFGVASDVTIFGKGRVTKKK